MIIYQLKHPNRTWVCSWGPCVLGETPSHSQWQRLSSRREARQFARCMRNNGMDIQRAIREYCCFP
jgi:hypothetical protein